MIATAVWAGFWVAGWPAYYQQYSVVQMLWLDTLLLIPVALIVHLVLKRPRPAKRLTVALWLKHGGGRNRTFRPPPLSVM